MKGLKEMRDKFMGNKGITLIALIVTIVVIVILGIILGIYFKVRLSKNPDGSQPKRLRKTLKKRKEEDTSLLSNAV